MIVATGTYRWPDGHEVNVKVQVTPGWGLPLRADVVIARDSQGYRHRSRVTMNETCHFTVTTDDKADKRWEKSPVFIQVREEGGSRIVVVSPGYLDKVYLDPPVKLEELLVLCRREAAKRPAA